MISNNKIHSSIQESVSCMPSQCIHNVMGNVSLSLSVYHPFFSLKPANTAEIETRRSPRAIKHWRHFLPPWLLLQCSSCRLFIVSLGFGEKFALQKLSILIIQFKLSHAIISFWKMCENTFLWRLTGTRNIQKWELYEVSHLGRSASRGLNSWYCQLFQEKL